MKPELKDIISASIRANYVNGVLSSPGWVLGSTSKATAKIANTFSYVLNNIVYSKATAEIAYADTTAQAPATTAYYAIWVAADGTTFSITNGTAVLTSALNAGTAVATLPANQDAKLLVGAVKIVCTSAATFTPGTTLHDAAGVTATFYNIMRYPTDGIPGNI
jgi:hypothetical protein